MEQPVRQGSVQQKPMRSGLLVRQQLACQEFDERPATSCRGFRQRVRECHADGITFVLLSSRPTSIRILNVAMCMVGRDVTIANRCVLMLFRDICHAFESRWGRHLS